MKVELVQRLESALGCLGSLVTLVPDARKSDDTLMALDDMVKIMHRRYSELMRGLAEKYQGIF